MFEDRELSIFPHPLSAWWITVVVGFLIVTGSAVAILAPNDEGAVAAFIFGIEAPCLFLLALEAPIQAFRLLMYFVNRVPVPPER